MKRLWCLVIIAIMCLCVGCGNKEDTTTTASSPNTSVQNPIKPEYKASPLEDLL